MQRGAIDLTALIRHRSGREPRKADLQQAASSSLPVAGAGPIRRPFVQVDGASWLLCSRRLLVYTVRFRFMLFSCVLGFCALAFFGLCVCVLVSCVVVFRAFVLFSVFFFVSLKSSRNASTPVLLYVEA